MLGFRNHLLDTCAIESAIKNFITLGNQNINQIFKLLKSCLSNHPLNQALIEHGLIFLCLFLHHCFSTYLFIILSLSVSRACRSCCCLLTFFRLVWSEGCLSRSIFMLVHFEESLLSGAPDLTWALWEAIISILILLSHQVVIQLLLVRVEDEFFGLLALLKGLLEIIRQGLDLKVDRLVNLVEIWKLDDKFFCLRLTVKRSKSCDFQALNITIGSLHVIFLLLLVIHLIDEVQCLLSVIV